MEPRSRERGNLNDRDKFNCGGNASMEPRSRERGNSDTRSSNRSRRRKLQWSRAQESAEIAPSTSPPNGMAGFNGAALKRARKYTAGQWKRSARYCFNGAALKRARKYCHRRSTCRGMMGCFNGAALKRARKSIVTPGCVNLTDAASMEPRSRERGNVQRGPGDRPGIVASMEPRSRERGNERT